MKKLNDYAHARFLNLGKELEQCRKIITPHGLHHIRIEIKKLKAIYRLLDSNLPSFNYSARIRPLRKIFRKAASIRNSDVMDELYIKYKIIRPKKSRGEMIQLNNSSIAAFRKNVPEYLNTIPKQEKKLVKYLKKLNSVKVKTHFLKLEEKLSAKFLLPFKEERLHPIRKKCKEIITLSRIVAIAKSRERIKIYDKLQDSIGHWHDKQILIASLQEDEVKTNRKKVSQLKRECTLDIKKIKPIFLKLAKL